MSDEQKQWVECYRCEGEGHLEIAIPGNWIECPECETVGGWWAVDSLIQKALKLREGQR